MSALSGLMGMLPGLLTGGAGAGLVNQAYENLGEVGQFGMQAGQALANTALEQTQFRPFAITSATGGSFGSSVDPATGQLTSNMSVSPQEQAFQNMMMSQAQQFGQQDPFGLTGVQGAGNQAFGLGNQFMQQAGMGTGEREQDIFNRIRAMQTPEEQRQQMALEERLQSQGRLGVRTNMYGGTPEQLAMEKARAEAMNQASLMAMQQGMQEQAQQANLGQSFATLGGQMAGTSQGLLGGQLGLSQTAQQGAYIPQAALIDSLQPGLNAANLAQQAQLTGAQLYGESVASGLDALLGATVNQGNLVGNLGAGLLKNSLGDESLGDTGQGFLDFLSGLGINF